MIAFGKFLLVAGVIGVAAVGLQQGDQQSQQAQRQLSQVTRIVTGSTAQIKTQHIEDTTADHSASAASGIDGQGARLAALGKDLHAALKQVGCYHGDVGAQWGEASRHAMREFNAKVGSHLPVDAPNHVLLTLVQGFQGKACKEMRVVSQQEALAATDVLPQMAAAPVAKLAPALEMPAAGAQLSDDKPNSTDVKSQSVASARKATAAKRHISSERRMAKASGQRDRHYRVAQRGDEVSSSAKRRGTVERQNKSRSNSVVVAKSAPERAERAPRRMVATGIAKFDAHSFFQQLSKS